MNTGDLKDIEHHFLDLIKWIDKRGIRKHFRLYSKICHMWHRIAIRLGLSLGEIESIKNGNYSDDRDRVATVLGRWLENDNAANLPNARKYPKSWRGLIHLLNDAELSEPAKDLKIILSSPWNDVRGNYSSSTSLSIESA